MRFVDRSMIWYRERHRVSKKNRILWWIHRITSYYILNTSFVSDRFRFLWTKINNARHIWLSFTFYRSIFSKFGFFMLYGDLFITTLTLYMLFLHWKQKKFIDIIFKVHSLSDLYRVSIYFSIVYWWICVLTF